MDSVNKNIADKGSELFDFFAIAPADSVAEEDVRRWREWVVEGNNAGMEYMSRERHDPQKILKGARTMVIVALAQPMAYQTGVARCFSSEEDYHIRVKNRLFELLAYIKTLYPTAKGRAVVDSAPIMEKTLAARAGLGWIGRNTLLITPRGSFFNLGVLLLDIELEAAQGSLLADKCGSCTRCIDACPNAALLPNRTLDVARCISYLNTEAPRLGLLAENSFPLHGWSKGCDICQSVCPWNNF